jgi:hypothetical protein
VIDAATAHEDGSAKPFSEMTSPQATSSEAQPTGTHTAGFDGAAASRRGKQSDISAAEPAAFETLPQALKIVGAVIAPTSLLTALMYYFGRMWATGFFRYLGVHFTVLDLTVQDYLIRSVDGLILPMIIVAGATLVALWVHRLLLETLPARIRRIVLRALMPSSFIAGSVLVTVALTNLQTPVLFARYLELRGLSFSVGVLLLAYAARLLRLLSAERRAEQPPRRPPGTVLVTEWVALFVLVSIGLFWAVGDYANLVGMGRAQQLEFELQQPASADVVAYSEKRLNLQAPGIREVPCQYPDAAYRFRYEGLKLVLQSGNQYLFLPAGWTHANGTAILLPRNESLRLEFSPAGQARNSIC